MGFVWAGMVMPTYAQSVSRAEYFFDTDPGLAKGTSITIPVSGNQVDITTDIPVTGLNSGFHNLFIRTMNVNGVWGLYEARNFYIKPVVSATTFQLKQAEYFFDTDPGLGNGTAVTAFTKADQISITQDISTTGLSSGFHHLYIRVKSDDNHWSLYESRNFYIKPVISSSTYKLVKAEYFFDSDPGLGKGTTCTAFVSDASVSLSQDVSVSTLSPGFHNLFVRLIGDNGGWSMYEARNFYIKPAAEQTDNVKLTSAEYFFDTDPGEGLATGFAAFTPSDQLDITQSPSITGLNTGTHILNIRVKNSLELYSHVESRSFEICSALPVANFTYDLVCTGIPTSFTNTTTSSDNSTLYKWDIKADGSVQSTNKDSTRYKLTTTTNVKLIAYNSQKCSDTIVISVPVKQTPAQPVISRLGNDSLAASVDNVTYNWYLEGTALNLHTRHIRPATKGNYTAETVSDGCISALSTSFYFVGTGNGTLVLPGFKIYPNPSNGNFIVEFANPGNDDILVTVINQTGEEIYQIILKNQPIVKWEAKLKDQIGRGVYYIRFSSKSKILIQKMVMM